MLFLWHKSVVTDKISIFPNFQSIRSEVALVSYIDKLHRPLWSCLLCKQLIEQWPFGQTNDIHVAKNILHTNINIHCTCTENSADVKISTFWRKMGNEAVDYLYEMDLKVEYIQLEYYNSLQNKQGQVFLKFRTKIIII